MIASSGSVSPARACAYAVLRRVFEHGAYADRALHSEAAGLSPRDRALAMAIAYGAIQRRATLDWIVVGLTDRPVTRLDPSVLAALRIGLLQLLLLDGVADHAAVNESVELAKRSGRGGGLVNAVLRRAAREGETLLAALGDRTPQEAAILHSVPEWLAERWWKQFGADPARELLRAVNRPAESALRVNTLRAGLEDVHGRLAVAAHTVAELSEALVLDGSFDAHGSQLFAEGAIVPQSRASMHVARALEPRPGERVLDLCAAPGGKTSHLAALMGDRGEIVAVERHGGRAQALRRTCTRLHAFCVRVLSRDATEPVEHGSFARVLVDPPCSGLGTLQSRPDLRWRVSPESIAELAALQSRILAAAGAATAAGGRLVYSVCTISPEEAEQVIDRFLDAQPEFEPVSQRQLLPSVDGTDGFFIAVLCRR
ncbi:MAG: 16S rRNA (cytosine(967)-C(5))-methyltransferase RsmB [Solirubrobacteraceae bacterium]